MHISFSGRSSAIICLLLATTVPGQNQVQGTWDAPISLLVDGVHAALLPTGKVVYLPHRDSPSGLSTSVVFDPANPAGASYATTPQNYFCGGHAQLSDGQQMFIGGETILGPGGILKQAGCFSPTTETWTEVADMNRRRWYGSALLYGDGTVWMFGGMEDAGGSIADPTIEFYNPRDNTWTMAGGQDIPGQWEEAYNRLHLLPDGRFFQSGHLPQTYFYDPPSRSWTFVATTNLGAARGDGGSVRLQDGRVLLVGGHDGNTIFASAEIIDLNQPNPQWVNVPSMAYPRAFVDTVLLPDGNVFVLGGDEATEPGDRTPELYDPQANTWTPMAPHTIGRAYHSTALLLPDGRVICSGGTDNGGPGIYEESAEFEIWNPYYLYRTPRPVITALPATASYGEQLSMQYTSSIPASHVVIHKSGSCTHAFTYNQISKPINFDGNTGGTATFTIPNNPNELPPGYYLVFLMSTDGVPSVGQFVKIGGSSLLVNGGLAGGSAATIRVGGMTPGNAVTVAFSLTGPGPLPVTLGCGPASVELSWPLGLLGVPVADAAGTASLTTFPVPLAASGLPVWIDALDTSTCTSPAGVALVIQ